MSESHAELELWIKDAVGRLLGSDPDTIDVERPLTELGIASRDALALVAELEDHLGRRLDATLVWRAPTISALATEVGAQADDVAGPAERSARRDADRADRAATPSARAGVDRSAHATRTPVSDDPVAVVGVGVRLPGGVEGPDAFWSQLLAGRESTGEVPAGRWESFPPPTPAGDAVIATTSRRGGYLRDVAGFDADWFGISPREAQVVDPGQRLLLEVATEALAHAGIAPSSLAGTATGVWVGMSTNEYAQLTMTDVSSLDAWSPTGAALSIAANRLSYLLDLRGPSMTLDTACSSSLVAVHHAVRSLTDGEVDTAIVGGVNLLLAPAITVTFDRAGALAPDGRCKPFSADADGIVRAEGVGAVVLKRLSQARADGDRVLAVLRGTGVGSDGRSNGLMAPNPVAQEDLLHDVYTRHGIDPGTVDYVEAHGTGTLLGDPIEAGALAAVLGQGRTARTPLLIGSAKGNLGHAEAAAGIVGFIKTVLALHRQVIPPSLHARKRNPHIPFADWHLDVVGRLRPWPRYAGVARAGVSAFGFGGTNAHVILEEAPADPHDTDDLGSSDPTGVGALELTAGPTSDEPLTAVLSGADDSRVADQAVALADWLVATPTADLRAVSHTLARRRHDGGRRAVAVGRGRDGLVAALRAVASGEQSVVGVAAGLPGAQPGARATRPAGMRPGAPADAGTGAVWVFSGYGSHWWGMGESLMADEPAFAKAIDDLTPRLLAESGVDLRAIVEGAGDPRRLGVAEAQIALFGMQIALAATWTARGHRPAAVIGHSLGEVAASVVSGGLSVDDGIRVISTRSRLLEQVAARGGGLMAVLELGDDDFARLQDRFPDVVVAVHASPRQLTVAGDADQVRELAAHVDELGRGSWLLDVAGAGHSPAVDPILDELVAGIASITPQPGELPFYTTVLDDPREQPRFDPDYWRANARRGVRFAQAVAAAAADGHTRFVEVSPHPVAGVALRAGLQAAGVTGTVVGTLRRDADSTVAFRCHLAVLAGTPGYAARGTSDDPEGLGVPLSRHIDLPGPVWRHVPYWVAPVRRPQTRGAHSLLGAHVALPDGSLAFGGDVGLDASPWLADHAVHGVAVFPAAGFAEVALTAGARALAPRGGSARPASVELADLELEQLLVLGQHTTVTTTARPVDSATVRVEVFAEVQGSLTRHATALVRRVSGADTPTTTSLPDPSTGDAVDLAATFAAVGHRYGPAFSGASAARIGADGVVSARVALPDEAPGDPSFTVHPALLDICLQVLAPSAGRALAEAGRDTTVPHLPVAIGSLRVTGDPQRGGVCVAGTTVTDAGLVGEVRLVADSGETLLHAQGVLLRPLGRADVAVPLSAKAFELVWDDAPLETDTSSAATSATTSWLVAGEGRLADAVGSALTARHDRAPSRVATLAEAARGLADLTQAAARLGEAVGVVLVPTLPSGSDSPGSGSELDRLGTGAVLEVAGVAAALVAATDGLAALGLPALPPGAVQLAVATRDAERSPGLAALRGLVRVLGIEHPLLHARLLDVVVDDADDDDAADADESLAASADRLAADLATCAADGSSADEVRWQGARRLARHLRRAEVVPDPTAPAHGLRAGAYVVTGGLGGLGLLVAQHLGRTLGDAGVLEGEAPTRIVLAGRSADPATADPAVAAVAATGVEVLVVRADVSDRADVDRLVAAATAGGVPLRGVVHAAGVLADELVSDLSSEALQRVWAPKVLGGQALHEATVDLDLDLWCVFSSAAALLGSPGQAAYATANAWLDALVAVRRAQGLPGSTINWGAWTGVGGAEVSRNALLDPMGVDEGLEAFAEVLASGREATGVVRLDLERMVTLMPGLATTAFFAPLLAERASGLEGADEWVGLDALRELSADDAVAALHDRLVSRVAGIMGQAPERLDVTTPLTRLGVDSLMAVRAKNAVESDVGVTLPMRLMLGGASLADVRDHIATQLGLLDDARALEPSPLPTAPAREVEQPEPAPAPITSSLAQQPGFVEARDVTERWLASVWAQALAIPAPGVTQPVAELLAGVAADTADAARGEVVSALHARFAAGVDADAVLAEPTLERQADVIRPLVEGRGDSVVRVLRAPAEAAAPSDEVPLFLFHPAGSPTAVYEPLLALVGGGFAAYGLERLETARTIEEKADRYLEMVRSIRPHGPYRLGGWSLGGCLAYELAGRLQAQGEQVDLLFLVDSVLPDRMPGEDETDVLRLRFARFIEHVRDTYGAELGLDPDELVTHDEDEQVSLMMGAVGRALPFVGPAILEHQRTSYVDARVAERYRPQPYDGPVVLYRATEVGLTTTLDPRYARTDDALGWDLLAPELEVVRVPGNHTSIIDRPGVDTIADHLRLTLQELSSRRPAPPQSPQSPKSPPSPMFRKDLR